MLRSWQSMELMQFPYLIRDNIYNKNRDGECTLVSKWDRFGFFPVRSRLTPRHDRSLTWTAGLSVCPACQLPPGSHLAPGGRVQLVPGPCQANWPGFGFAGGTGVTCRVRVCHGEQALWKKSSRKEPCTICQSLLMASCRKTRRFLQGERPRKGSLVAEVSSELVGSELMWLIPIIASSPYPVMSLVPVHQSHIDSVSYLPAKGEVDVMEHLVFVFLMLLFMQVREIRLMMEGKFGEGLCSLKMFNPQAEGSGQTCTILSAESSQG